MPLCCGSAERLTKVWPRPLPIGLDWAIALIRPVPGSIIAIAEATLSVEYVCCETAVAGGILRDRVQRRAIFSPPCSHSAWRLAGVAPNSGSLRNVV